MLIQGNLFRNKETTMKQIIVSCLVLIIGFTFPVSAQENTKAEIFIGQLQDKENTTTDRFEETIKFPDHPLIGTFLNLQQTLVMGKNNLGNIAYAFQDGSSNITDISQIGYNHVALSWQQGNNNFHTINQNGFETTSSGIQIGDGNRIQQLLEGATTGMVIQLGDGNLVEQVLSGAKTGTFLIQQEGNNNSLFQLETGVSVPYQIHQRGNDMELIIINSTIQ